MAPTTQKKKPTQNKSTAKKSTAKKSTAKKSTAKKSTARSAGKAGLPDGEFAFPQERKEPLSDARHVRNAIARFNQVEGVTDKERDQAWRRIVRAAKQFGVEVHEGGWRELGGGGKAKKKR